MEKPTLNESGIPTPETLVYFEQYPEDGITEAPHGVMADLKPVWAFSDRGCWKEQEEEIDGKRVVVYSISTGNWPGNELLLSCLAKTAFWGLYWESTRRGGHYKFHVPAKGYKKRKA